MLRIFEQRYLSMTSRCLRQGHGFGVVLIDSGSEVGAARFVSTGTIAEIVDWHQGRDGLLGIVAEGHDRFSIASWRRQPDGLYVGELELLAGEPELTVPDEFAYLRELVEVRLERLGAQYERTARSYDDATWLGYRLSEVLPLSAVKKQALLELDDPRQRLELLQPHLEQINSIPS
jgi:hypothetical protein